MSNLCNQCSLACLLVLILQTHRPKTIPAIGLVSFPSQGNQTLEEGDMCLSHSVTCTEHLGQGRYFYALEFGGEQKKGQAISF